MPAFRGSIGEIFTDQARNIAWYDRDMDRAIVQLMDAFEGIDTALARKIINGERKLVTMPDGTVEDRPDNDFEPPYDDMEEDRKEGEAILKKAYEYIESAYAGRSLYQRASDMNQARMETMVRDIKAAVENRDIHLAKTLLMKLDTFWTELMEIEVMRHKS